MYFEDNGHKWNMIQGDIEGKKVLINGWQGVGTATVAKEYDNNEVLYTNGVVGRVEDIIKVID